jgi:lactate racemase
MDTVTEIALAYGRGTTLARLPSARLGSILYPPPGPPVVPTGQVVNQALADPVASLPLSDCVRPGDRVAVLVSDITRATRADEFLPLVLNGLNRGGVPDRDVRVVFANGLHRGHRPDEWRMVVGDEALARVALADHDARGPVTAFRPTRRGTPVEINTVVAEADRRILTGSIVHHWTAGYGGGRKSVVPGVSSRRAVVATHSLMLEPGCGAGVLAGNPMHEDMVEAVAQLRPDFLVNTVVDAAGRVTDVVAGHWIAAHEAGCRIVDRRCGAELGGRADVVVASCGGFPRDINVYQAQKALENAVRAVRPGGLVILVAECRDGHGDEEFLAWMRAYHSTAEMEEQLRGEFVMGGHKALGFAQLLDRARVVLVSSLPHALVAELWMTPAATVEEALDAYTPPDASIAVMPFAAITYPLVGDERARELARHAPRAA